MSRGRAPSRPVRWATTAYRRALVVLPTSFRRAWTGELVATFERVAVDAHARRGAPAVLAVLVGSLWDLARRAPREHLTASRTGPPRRRRGGGVWLDLRHAARRLLRRPSFTAAAVLVLGLGVAAATSVFTLVHGVVLSPLPYPEPDGIVVVDHGGTGLGIDGGLGITYGVFRHYAERARQAEALAMYGPWTATLTDAGEPLRVDVVRATPSLVRVLRVEPRLGRWFTPEEGGPGAGPPPVAVLSHRLWRDRFGSDPEVIGRAVTLDDTPFEVVGVMPQGFAFPDPTKDLWIPRAVPLTGVGGWNETAVARLAPGRAPADLERELAALLPSLVEATDDPVRARQYVEDAGVFPRVVGLKESVVGGVEARLWILLGSVGVVMLIALANVANLLLVRAEDAQRETAVRAALGASRVRLVRTWLAESLLLAALAGAVGTAGAAVGVSMLRRWAPVNVPRLDEVALHGPALAVAVGLCLVAGLLLGVVPALRGGARDVAPGLGHGGRATADRRRLAGRNVLVASQVALALVLLIASGLLLRTFRHMQSVDLGFTERQALTFELSLPSARYGSRDAARQFHDALRERLASLPGVMSAATVFPCLPLSGNLCWGEVLLAEGRPTPGGEVPPVTGVRVVTGDYFGTMGIRVRGRGVGNADAEADLPVAVLSEAAAAAYFPGEDPLGRRISFGGREEDDWFTVVGVAENVKSRLTNDDNQRVIYLPALTARPVVPPVHQMTYVLRSAVPPESLAPAVRDVVWELDDALPLARVRGLDSLIAEATAPTAFALTLIGLAALAALMLGVVGVYAVVAYAVSRRTAEIGLRMALGARSADVRWMVLGQGAAVVGAGLLLGLVGAFAVTRVLGAMLYGVEPTDPGTYAVLTAAVALVAAAALWLPAVRAARVDPLRALRSE